MKTTTKPEQEYDAIIDNWFWQNGALVGNISKDKKGRFEDGTLVHTSSIKTDMDKIAEGNIVETRNSIYLLGRPGRLEV